jgi:hypothetical protein
MTSKAASEFFAEAEKKAAEAVDLYAKPIGLGARQSIEHQGIQALAESIQKLAQGLLALSDD